MALRQFSTYPFEVRVWFDIDRISHRLDAIEDDLDAVLIPVVREVKEWVKGGLTQQEGRVVHTHRGVLWVLDDGRTSCKHKIVTLLRQ